MSCASLEALVTAADPVLPSGKNTRLRESMTVTGAGGRSVTVALGELDRGFGKHPAVLTVDRRRHITLVIPGDAARCRSIADVRSISVAVPTATAETPAAGCRRVRAASRMVERGGRHPGRPRHRRHAVGGDGYGASVTEGEALSGGQPLLISLSEDGAPLAQPRLITAGAVKGGRDVSGLVVPAVTRPGR